MKNMEETAERNACLCITVFC